MQRSCNSSSRPGREDSSSLILLRQKLQDVVLVDLLAFVVEQVDNLSQLARVDEREQSLTFGEALSLQADGHVELLFLTLLHFPVSLFLISN